MPRERGLVGHVLATTTGNMAIPLAAFASAPILARTLGVEERGILAAGTAPMLLAISALTLGIPEALTYYISKYGSSKRALLRAVEVTLTAGLLGTGALALIALIVTPENQLVELMLIAGLALVPALLVGIVRGYAAGLAMWSTISQERLVGAITRLVSIGLLAYSGQLTLLTATIAVSCTTFIGGCVYVGAFTRPADVLRVSASVNRTDLLSFGLQLWPGALAGILLSRLDQTLMIGLADVYELGIYAVAVSVSEVPLVFNSAVRDVIFAKESREQSRDRLMRAARVSTMGTIVASLCVGVGSIWMLPLLFGEEFRAATIVTEILLVGIVLGNPGSVAGAGLSARGRPALRSCSLGIALGVNIAAVVVLVPCVGAVGAALATVMGNFVAGSLNIMWLRVHYRYPVSGFLRFRRSDLLFVVATVRGLVRSDG